MKSKFQIGDHIRFRIMIGVHKCETVTGVIAREHGALFTILMDPQFEGYGHSADDRAIFGSRGWFIRNVDVLGFADDACGDKEIPESELNLLLG